MKFLLKGLIAASLLVNASAFACPSGTICPGDRVYPDAFSAGYATVIAINPSTDIVTVQGNYSSTYNRYTLNEISLPQGCLGAICVGDQVIPDAYSKGYATVIAINPHRGLVTVLGNYSSTYNRYYPNQFGIKKGCADAVCVGDEVFPDNYRNGYATVIAINPANQEIIVLGNNSSSYNRYTAQHLSITKYCETYDKERRH